MPWLDMLRGKGTFGNATVYFYNPEPPASYGSVGEVLDEPDLGEKVRLIFYLFLILNF